MVSYLQLAHNERHPKTGSPVARIIHNFGRADQVDREALRRLVASISRFLDPAEAVAAGSGAEVEIVDARRCGGAFVLDALFARLGIGKALRSAAEGRRLDAELVERICFALIAQRALEPASKLAATRWVAERVAIEGCPAFDADAAYAAMDFLLSALPQIAESIFATTANLLNLACDVIFLDTSSTYFEVDLADAEVELGGALDEAEARAAAKDGGGPAEAAARRFSRHSKDKRPDAPQVVIGMAVTAEGIPVRCWTFPGNASDQLIVRTIRDDLAGWKLNRVLWVADSGFDSLANRAYLQRGGGHYVLAERLRSGSAEVKAALSRAGRYRQVAGNLAVKEVRLGDGARAARFVVVHNPEAAARDRSVRAATSSWERCAAGQRSTACCAAPRRACYASTVPPSHARRASTAAGCCAAPMRRSRPPTWRSPTASSTRSSTVGATSKERSSCGRCSTTARTASAPTCSSAGWRCCSSASSRTPPAAAGEPCATSLSACTW